MLLRFDALRQLLRQGENACQREFRENRAVNAFGARNLNGSCFYQRREVGVDAAAGDVKPA